MKSYLRQLKSMNHERSMGNLQNLAETNGGKDGGGQQTSNIKMG